MWVFDIFYCLKGDVCVFSAIPREVLNCPHSMHEILMLSYFSDVSKDQNDYANMSWGNRFKSAFHREQPFITEQTPSGSTW